MISPMRVVASESSGHHPQGIRYLLGACARALAAACFSVFVLLGFDRTLPAAEAAFLPV